MRRLNRKKTLNLVKELDAFPKVIFELSPMQREWQRILQNIQARLQEEHSLQDIIFKSAFKSASTALPPRAIPHPRGHAHLAALERVINHAAGSHGVSGIFMKYDISSLMVTVTEEHMPFWQFIVRLCGIVGGIFSTT
ncbi:Endoplasmic reticulum-Golgi intermediate compartment protein 2, partial [Ophiophagus hannah]